MNRREFLGSSLASELSRGEVDEAAVVEEFKRVAGLSRQDVATHLLKVFDLEERARASMENLEAGRPWQAFARLRLAIYEKMMWECLLAHQRDTHGG